MTVNVRYYARLKEEAGLAGETVQTHASTVGDLWKELEARHGFTLGAGVVLAAQADEYCGWEAELIPGRLVVFMPPVAGG